MGARSTVLLVSLAALIVVLYTQVTLFVVQPIGAVPEGRTLVLWRTGKLKFIDSADGVCGRQAGGVSLLCRMAVLGTVDHWQRTLRTPAATHRTFAAKGVSISR